MAPARIWQQPLTTAPASCDVVFSDVTKDYATAQGSFAALRATNLAIGAGEVVAIEGPSGSGKSTLLNLLAGIDRPTSGCITVGGISLTQLGEEALTRWRGAHVGLVFQFFQLMPTLTALENVLLAQEFQRTVPRDRDRAGELLARVGLTAVADHLPAELSGGEQQRVAIARALVNDPPLLLADEPTGNLDTEAGERVMDLLTEFAAGGRTLVFVTHDAALASRAERVLRVRDGVIVEDRRGAAG